jgi:hypothetical protein
MNAKERIATHGLTLALGLASVAAGQSGSWEPTRDVRPRGWATVFAAPPLRSPVKLTLLAAREGIVSDRGDGRDRATLVLVPVDARPPPLLGPRSVGAPTGEASVTVETPVHRAAIFFDVLGGTERRVRPTEETDRAFAVGSPIVALKFGVAQRFRTDWEVAGSLGATVGLFAGEQRVNASSVFAEVEVNRYLARSSFIGTGLSLWDLPRSGLWTPAWLLHFGIPLSRSARYAVFFIGEGRLFLARLGDVTGNYEIWGGVQMRLRR